MHLAKYWAAQLDDYVIDLAWSPDGRQLATASAAGPITLFDAQGTRRHVLPGHEDGTNVLAWQFPGKIAGPVPPAAGSGNSEVRSEQTQSPVLASGGQDGKVKFWESAAGEQAAEAALGSDWVEHLAWRPAAAQPGSDAFPGVAAASGRRLLLLRPDGSIAHAFKDAPKTLSALAWHPQGGGVATAYYGGVCVWDSDDFLVQREYAYGSAIHALVWSPDGRWLVAGAQDNAVHLWIPEEEQEFHMSGYETKVRELSFSHDSRWLATGGARDACIWDCSGAGPEGREPLALPHADRVCAVAFQQAHGLLATAANDNEVSLWSPTRREPLVANVRLTAPASKLVWSPDDTLLAIGSQKGGVLVLKVDQ